MKKFLAIVLVLTLLSGLFAVHGFASEKADTITASIPAGEVGAGTIIKLSSENEFCDIWYTTDGSNPANSKTAFLYSEERGIIITHDVTIKACTKDANGVGAVNEFKYNCPLGYVADDVLWELSNIAYAVSLDTSNKKFGENSIKIVGGSGRYISTGEIAIDSNFDYKLGFWVKTERLGIDDAVSFKVFLSGAGNERHPFDSQKTGATLGNYGESFFEFKADQDWTYYEVDINNMLGLMDSVTLILYNNSVSGLAWIDGVTLKAEPKANYPVNVVADDSVYANIYNEAISEDSVIKQGIVITNSAKNLEKGKLSYKIVDDTKPTQVIQKGSFDISVDGGSEKNQKLQLNKVNKYGTFTIDFKMTNSSGVVYNAGQIKLSRLIDNTYLIENGGTYLGACGTIVDQNGADASKYIGNSMLRFDYDWTDIEKEKGVYTIDAAKDSWINRMVENNIEPILIFNTHGWPEWMEQKGWPTTESDLEHFLGYVKFLVETYKGKVKYFEFYNEVNYRGWVNSKEFPNAEGYTKTMKEVYRVLKEANPEAMLLGGSTSGIAIDWARTMFENGAADYMDYYSFHPYSQEGSPETADWVKQMKELNNTIKKVTGEYFPLFITEVGYATARVIERGYSVEEQMAYLTRICTMAKSIENLEKIVTYQIGSGKKLYETENQYGMLGSGFAKPLAVARAAFNHLHNGFEYEATLDLAENLYAYKFSGKTEDMYVLWTNDIESYADIVTSDKSAELYDIFGNKIEVKYKKNEFKTEVGAKIIYIRLKKGEKIESVTLKAKATLSKEEKEDYERYFNGKTFPWKYIIIGAVVLLLLGIAAVVIVFLNKKAKS